MSFHTASAVYVQECAFDARGRDLPTGQAITFSPQHPLDPSGHFPCPLGALRNFLKHPCRLPEDLGICTLSGRGQARQLPNSNLPAIRSASPCGRQRLPLPRSINRPEVPILVVSDMPRPDRILPLGQDQNLIQRKPQNLVRRNQRPFFRPPADIGAVLQCAYSMMPRERRDEARMFSPCD